MKDDEYPILGYRKDGTPIYPARPGQVTTAAFILCSRCNAAICSHGGPSIGAHCLECAKSDGHE